MSEIVKIGVSDADEKPVANIAFRKNTADERTIRMVMERLEYDTSRLRRHDELVNIHQKALMSHRAPLIVDLGANIGVSALYFNHVWPGSKIVAVEPERNNFALLFENTVDLPNITAIHAGIASNNGALRIADDNANTDAFRTVVGGGDIRAISMPTLLREQDGEPFICKIDIEGAERELFSKDTDWIDLFPLIMIELHDWMLSGEAASHTFLQAISQRRRDFIFRGETVFSVRC